FYSQCRRGISMSTLNLFRVLVEIGFLNLYNWRDFGYVWHSVSHGFSGPQVSGVTNPLKSF
ncbi:MAG: hypothetical protein ACPG9R_12655, partial [Marinobacter salsuginis]